MIKLIFFIIIESQMSSYTMDIYEMKYSKSALKSIYEIMI